MEIKENKNANYPLLIKDLVKELLKDDFVHFKILCANEVHHFNKEDGSVIELSDAFGSEDVLLSASGTRSGVGIIGSFLSLGSITPSLGSISSLSSFISGDVCWLSGVTDTSGDVMGVLSFLSFLSSFLYYNIKNTLNTVHPKQSQHTP